MKRALSAILVTLVIFTTACTAPTTPAGNASTTAAPATSAAAAAPAKTDATAATAPAAATAQPSTGGHLRIGWENFANETLDPPVGGVASTSMLFRSLYDFLTGPNEDGTGSDPERGIASKWEQFPGAMGWKFYLRKGILFHDGTELTAEDVKFSIDRLKEDRSAVAAQVKEMIDRVDVIGPYEVDLRLKRPNFTLVENELAGNYGGSYGIVPKKYIEKNGNDYFIKRPIGSGPLKFVAQVPGSHVTFEANKSHWKIKNFYYDRVTFNIVPEESTRISMLKTGELDVSPVSRNAVASLKNNFNMVSRPGTYMLTFWLFPIMNKTSPLYNQQLRKAMMLAINKDEIVSGIFRGSASVYPGAWPVFPTSPGYVKLAPDPFDPAKAKQLLAAAGYTGREINFYSVPRQGVPEARDTVELVANYWENIGLKVNIIPMDFGAFRQLWAEKKLKDPAVVIQTQAATRFSASLADSLLRPGRLLSVTDDPPLDAMIADLLGAKTVEEYTPKETNMLRYLAETQSGQITVAMIDEVVAANKSVHVWDGGQFSNDIGILPLIWKK